MEPSFVTIDKILKLTQQPFEIRSESFSFETLLQVAKKISCGNRNLTLVVGNNLSLLQIEMLIEFSGDHFILKF